MGDLVDLVNQFPSSEGYIKDYCQKVMSADPSAIFCEYCRKSGHDLENCRDLKQLASGRQGAEYMATSSGIMFGMPSRLAHFISASSSASSNSKGKSKTRKVDESQFAKARSGD